MKTSDKIAVIRQTPFSRYLVRFWNWLVVSPVSAMLCSFVISGILIAILGYNPFVTYGYLLVGAFGGLDKLVSSLDDGREMLAAQALKAGFIDGIARCDDYVDSLLEQTGLILYEKPEPQNFSTLLDWIYGRIERLVPRTDGELLQEFADANEGITVMASAG